MTFCTWKVIHWTCQVMPRVGCPWGRENLAISTLGPGMVLVPEAIVVGYYVQ